MIDLLALLTAPLLFRVCLRRPDRAFLWWLFLSPLSYDTLVVLGVNLRVVSFDRLVFLGTAIALLARGELGRLIPRRFSKMEKACLVYILAYCFEALIKLPPRTAFSSCTYAFDTYALPLYWYLFIKYLLTRDGDYDHLLEGRMAKTLAIVGFYCAGMGIFEGVTGIDLFVSPFAGTGEYGLVQADDGIVRANGPFLVPEILGQYMSWILLLVLYRWRVHRLSGPASRPTRRLFRPIYALLLGAGMYFTMFRNVWGGCLGGCSIRYLFSRRGRATFLLVTTLLFAGIAVNWGSITRTALYQDRISNVANIYDRLGAWLYAFRAFSEHPLTGLGPDRIKQYIKKAQEAGDDLRVMDVPATWHPHNTIIAQLAENGLLVVVPLCLMIWYFIGEVRACIRLARSPADVEFGLYAVAVAFAIFAPGLTDRAYEWAKLNNLMYVVFALVAAHGVKLRKLARLELAERPRHVVLKELAGPAHQTGSTKSAGVRPAFLNPLLVRAEGHQPEPALAPRDRSSR